MESIAKLVGFLFLASLTLAPAGVAQTPAAGAPGFTGWGSQATVPCDRSTVHVHSVTSLAGRGPGTLDTVAYQLTPGELDYVVFETGGLIENIGNGWGSPSNMPFDCVIVDAMHAPGDGIHIRSAGRWLRLDGGSQDVVLRGFSYFSTATDVDTSSPNAGIHDATRVYIERTTWGWCREACIAGGPVNDTDDLTDITLDRNLFGEPNFMEPTLVQFSICAVDEGCTQGVPSFTRASWVQNVFAHGSHRNPAWGGQADGQGDEPGTALAGVSQFAGHLIYNHNQGTIQAALWDQVDIRDVLIHPGPRRVARGIGSDDWHAVAVQVDLDQNGGTESVNFDQRFHFDNIQGEKNSDPDATQSQLTAEGGARQEVACYIDCPEGDAGNEDASITTLLGSSVLADTALTQPTPAPPRITVAAMLDSLANQGRSGAHLQVDSLGNRVQRTTDFLARMHLEISTQTGISNPQEIDAAWIEDHDDWLYTLDEGTAPRDTDSDGVQDACEIRYYGGLAEGAASDTDGDEWTLIEECRGGTDPTTANGVSAPWAGGGGSGSLAGTYNVVPTVYVVHAPTVIFNGVYTPDPDSIAGLSGYFFPSPDGLETLLVVTNGTPDSDLVLDSAVVDSICRDWDTCTSQDLRSVPLAQAEPDQLESVQWASTSWHERWAVPRRLWRVPARRGVQWH